MGHAGQNLHQFTKGWVESMISDQYASWFGNNSQAILKIFEDNYLKPGTADDDNMAWLQFAVDVKKYFKPIIQGSG